ncbi:transposable element Tcb2 transposase [Trichonephila clavipes]|nr:transposable element Tcb2 transposase [Trichonephila clavipes]
MYGSTCADMQVDVMGECLSSIKHVVGTTSGCFYPRSNHWEVGGRPQCDKCGCRVRNCSQHRFTTLETISNYRNSYPGFSSGRPRGTTPADDRYIVLQARRNRWQTAGEIARHMTQATGRPILRFTVARRLHGGGLFARRPVRCVPLTPAHRRRRSLWCREHRNWRDNEWGRVLFTDESRFSLSSDFHRILIWRERGSRNHPSNIIERDRYGGRGVLVWEGIMLGSRTDLHIFDAGSFNGTRYCNEILLPYVRLFRGAMGLQFLFMDDNAPCHRTVAAEQLLESRRLAARTLPPVTIRELRLALQDEWAAMPQQLIDTLILSMGRRCETCLAVSEEIISLNKDRMFLAGHPLQGCFGLQSHCAPCYFFNKASFYPSDFSFNDFMRGRIIGKIEEGRKITDVAREFDIAHSVVSRLWKSFKTTGMCSRRHGGGRVRSTTPAEHIYIVLSAKSNRRTTAQQVADQFLAASGKQISRKTVARRLKGGGLYARRLVVCIPLTRQHRTARLQWCREHHNWTEQDWACVLFSDESRFSLSSDCRRQLIWRESGTAYRPENIQEKDRYPTCSIMVWAGIMINGRTCLHVVANGTMTGQRYIDEVLLPHVRLFRGAVGDKFVFMDDNATCHRTLVVQDCLDSEGIQRLVWPARSPDLNPIENVWDALGRQVAGRNYPPTNKNTLIRALTEEWDKLPQQLLDNVVQSMVRRVEYCITLHGGHIPY